MSGADRTVCDELIAALHEHEQRCSPDELRVLLAVAQRLELGRVRYGSLDLSSDGRDWSRELSEELVDAVIYAAIAKLAGKVKP